MKRLLIAAAALEPGARRALLCVATIMPDEFFNMYDKTGPGMSNYKPDRMIRS